jgi:hypothetical protein
MPGGDMGGGMTDDLPIPLPPESVGELAETPLRFVTSEVRRKLVLEDAMSLAMFNPNARNMEEAMDVRPFLRKASGRVDQRFPLVFDQARWQDTTGGIDELMFLWNGLPKTSKVRLYFPNISCEQIINLRNLRHAPGNVRIVDSHTLELIPDGTAYVPLPPVSGGHIQGVATVTLPAGIKKGQRWRVDVIQVRGGERRITGGFQMNIQVSQAALIFDAERRLLELMFERLSLLPATHPWRPVLERRVDTLRLRAKALADSAGLPWSDPTTWTDSGGNSHPFRGPRLRVVLEKIQVIRASKLKVFDLGDVRFRARVRTSNNGQVEQVTQLPQTDGFHVPDSGVLDINRVIFDGYAQDNLVVEIAGAEKEIFDPSESIGRYVRIFDCAADRWFGSYAPGDEVVDPEDVGMWRVWYRIERR